MYTLKKLEDLIQFLPSLQVHWSWQRGPLLQSRPWRVYGAQPHNSLQGSFCLSLEGPLEGLGSVVF